MNTVEGPTLNVELNVEGVNVTAIVDTATIIAQSLLHDIKRHLYSERKSQPKLELPYVPLRANLTAQVLLSYWAQRHGSHVYTTHK